MTLAKGRIPPKREVLSIRAIQREDLPRLVAPRDKSATIPQKLREAHHTVARFLATGIAHTQIAALTGYSFNRVSQLAAAPAMQELVAQYKDKVDQAWLDSLDPFYDLASRNMLKAERMLADKLEEAEETGETLPVRDLIAISRDAADRFGYGKTQTNINKNIDFAAELEKRIARQQAAQSGKLVELKAEPKAAPAPVTNPTSAPLRRLG